MLHRREFLLGMSAPALAGLAATHASAQDGAAGDAIPLLQSPPVIQHPTPTGFTVCWQVGAQATGWVEWGLQPDALDHMAVPARRGLNQVDTDFLSVRVAGVPEGATVHYRVASRPVHYTNAYNIERGDVVHGPVRSVRLPSPRDARLRIAVVNDTHQQQETVASLARRLDALEPDVLLWNGDTCNDFYDDRALGQIVLGPGAAPEDPSSGGWASTRPLLFVPGNHDVRGPRARTLPRALLPWPADTDPEATAAAAEFGGPWCFARRMGPVALIGLDTGEDKPDRRDVFAGLAAFEPWRRAQAVWLQKALQRPDIRGAAHLLAFAHIPLRGLPGQNDGQGEDGYAAYCGDAAALWLPILRDAGCKAVLSGHTHSHRIDPATDGLPPQVVGGGPQPERATLTVIEADAHQFTLRIETLQGDTLLSLTG